MIPLLGITGYSGSGKTTLLEKIVPELTALGLRVAVIKHSHHNATVDKEGKDSWRMKEVGASQVIMACDKRWALMTETPTKPVSLHYLAEQFDSTLTDLILVEGFKQEPIPKILLHRHSMTRPFPELDEHVLAVATDYDVQTDKVRLNINSVSDVVAFIVKFYHQQRRS